MHVWCMMYDVQCTMYNVQCTYVHCTCTYLLRLELAIGTVVAGSW